MDFKEIKSVDVLGTTYSIEFKDLNDDEYAKKNNYGGYCDKLKKEIVVINYNSLEGCENDSKERCEMGEKRILRHELILAYLTESGLSASSLQCSFGWAENEEMVDWLAIQLPKIYKTFNELGIL